MQSRNVLYKEVNKLPKVILPGNGRADRAAQSNWLSSKLERQLGKAPSKRSKRYKMKVSINVILVKKGYMSILPVRKEIEQMFEKTRGSCSYMRRSLVGCTWGR